VSTCRYCDGTQCDLHTTAGEGPRSDLTVAQVDELFARIEGLRSQLELAMTWGRLMLWYSQDVRRVCTLRDRIAVLEHQVERLTERREELLAENGAVGERLATLESDGKRLLDAADALREHGFTDGGASVYDAVRAGIGNGPLAFPQAQPTAVALTPQRPALIEALVQWARTRGPWDAGNPDHTAGDDVDANLYNEAVRACRAGLLPHYLDGDGS
jgi:hypothetical protein